MKTAVAAVGRMALNFLAETGEVWRLSVAAVSEAVVGPFRGRKVRLNATLEQVVLAGTNSVPLVILISGLLGMIMALQSAYQLRQLGALSLVANLVAVAVTRELAPLLTAIIIAGRFGSSIAAELGAMKTSQEIDALQVMGIDPVNYLVVPRLVGLVVALPCLTVVADLVGIGGGMLVGVGILEMGAGTYLADTIEALRMQDIYTGLIKALVFAVIIGLVGCRQGLSTGVGAAAVGRSTTQAVVRSIVIVIGADLLVTTLFYLRG